METFLGCLFALFIGILFFSRFLLKYALRFLLSLMGIKLPEEGKSFQQRTQGQSQRGEQARQQQQSSAHQHSGQNGTSNGKIFTKDESEYVDFEDVP